MLHENEILETIDCTPTWEALLMPMLDLYAQQKAGKRHLSDKQLADLLHEFKSMAKAADYHNASVRAMQGK